MRHQGIPLRRDKIMEHVWDSNADPFSHTIETHIWLLRRKIDGKGGKKLIHTVHGVGYKIEA
jgi:DNA-binding response OmpR family regulator